MLDIYIQRNDKEISPSATGPSQHDMVQGISKIGIDPYSAADIQFNSQLQSRKAMVYPILKGQKTPSLQRRDKTFLI